MAMAKDISLDSCWLFHYLESRCRDMLSMMFQTASPPTHQNDSVLCLNPDLPNSGLRECTLGLLLLDSLAVVLL